MIWSEFALAGLFCPGAWSFYGGSYNILCVPFQAPGVAAFLYRGRRASGRLSRDTGLFEPTPERPETGRDTVASSPKEGMDGTLSSEAAYDDDDGDGPFDSHARDPQERTPQKSEGKKDSKKTAL